MCQCSFKIDNFELFGTNLPKNRFWGVGISKMYVQIRNQDLQYTISVPIGAGWSWMELDRDEWSWVEMGGTGWRWGHGLVIPYFMQYLQMAPSETTCIREQENYVWFT